MKMPWPVGWIRDGTLQMAQITRSNRGDHHRHGIPIIKKYDLYNSWTQTVRIKSLTSHLFLIFPRISHSPSTQPFCNRECPDNSIDRVYPHTLFLLWRAWSYYRVVCRGRRASQARFFSRYLLEAWVLAIDFTPVQGHATKMNISLLMC